jgi:lipid-A-disaccharide synthase
VKILISAAETSSDIHGAELLRALQGQFAPGQIEAWGIGGPRLQAQGLRSLVDARSLLSMGFFELFGRLPKILGALGTIADAAARDRPDLAVVMDYPDFHFRLAKRLKKLGIPVVYYIPPKVWAWRQGRVKVLRERFVEVLSILPFEEDFFREHKVVAKYVGNPLVDELPLELSRAEARAKLGIGESLARNAGESPFRT